MTQTASIFLNPQFWRTLLKETLSSSPASDPERFVERMVRDFPDELNREQAFREFMRDPDFWIEFYDNDPRNMSKGKIGRAHV